LAGSIFFNNSYRIQVLTLENHSAVPVAFTVMAEKLSVFGMDVRFGVLKPSSARSLCVNFTPTAVCNSWKRLTIVLANADPLCLDLVGTGYSNEARPPTLSFQHIEAFLTRIGKGGSLLPSEQAKDAGLPEMLPLPPQMSAKAHTDPGSDGDQCWDVLFHGQDVTHGIKVEPVALTFAPTSASQSGEAQRLVVTNTLPAPVIASIPVPLWTDPEGAIKPTRVWQVSPAEVEIAPFSAVEFQAVFQPPADARYFSQCVDVVAHMKHMRNFQLCLEVRICICHVSVIILQCVSWGRTVCDSNYLLRSFAYESPLICNVTSLLSSP
jgi:hypothetical protein